PVKPRPRRAGWRASGVAEAQRVARWGFWARSLLMPCAIECAWIIQFMASCGRPMAVARGRLSDDEYKAFGATLRTGAEAKVWPAAIAAARFLAITGWCSGEALTLRWDEIDLVRRTATLRDTKTGRSVRPLSHAACDVMRNLSRSGHLVFPATRGSGDV